MFQLVKKKNLECSRYIDVIYLNIWSIWYYYVVFYLRAGLKNMKAKSCRAQIKFCILLQTKNWLLENFRSWSWTYVLNVFHLITCVIAISSLLTKMTIWNESRIKRLRSSFPLPNLRDNPKPHSHSYRFTLGGRSKFRNK